MRKISLVLGLVLVALAGCGGGDDGGSIFKETIFSTKYVALASHVLCGTSPATGVPIELCDLVLSVKESLRYGQDSDVPPTTIWDILNFGSGDCGEYASILAAELEFNKIKNWRRISVWSRRGAIHAFIEVSYNGKNYVLDPTLGLVYPSSFYALVAGYDDPTIYTGAIDRRFALYGGGNLYPDIDFFITYDPYWFEEENPENLYSFSTDFESVAQPSKPYFINISSLSPFQLRRSDGYANVHFSEYLASVGVWIPIRNAVDISLIRDQPGEEILVNAFDIINNAIN